MAQLTRQQAEEVKWALDSLQGTVGTVSRSNLLQTYANYYNGDHSLLFATPKFLETFGDTFRANTENLCRLPVDILADLLQVTGFAALTGEDVEADTQEIWRRNRMAERAGQVHKNTGLFGDSYVIVWPDEEDFPVIYPNLPGNVVVRYHGEQLGYIVQAAKYWVEDGFARLTIYTPELITRYRSRNKAATAPGAGSFGLYETDSVPAEQVNPYDKVPVFRFANNAGIGSSGESELRDCIAPQDRLNKGLCDLLLASEYSAYPQRYALGYEVKIDPVTGLKINPFKSGPERMWINENAAGTFGQLPQSDLNGYMTMIADARMAFSRVTGIPPHYLGMDTGGWPSGEALKTSSDRLTKKALDRQISYGNTWADVLRFCLQIQNKPDVEMETLWTDPTPRLSEIDSWNAALLEQQAGGLKSRTLQSRGYSAAEIEEAKAASLASQFGDGFPMRSADDEPVAEGVEA